MSLLCTHPGQSLIRCRCLPERDETLDLSHFLLPRAVLNEALSWGLAAANTNGSERICQHYGNLSGLGPLVWVADPSRMVSTPRLDWMFNTKYKSYIIRLLVSGGPASCLSTYHCILSTQHTSYSGTQLFVQWKLDEYLIFTTTWKGSNYSHFTNERN